MTNTEILQHAINTYGNTAQLEMAQEEATEMALAVRKYVRNPNNRTLHDLSNEIADVEIMIEQIKIILPQITQKIVEQKIAKIYRLKNRMKI